MAPRVPSSLLKCNSQSPPSTSTHKPSSSSIPNHTNRQSPLISHLDQIITQLLRRVGRNTGLHALGVVCYEQRLRRLDNHHTLTPLLAVETPVVRLDAHEPLPGDVESLALHFLDVGFVLVGGDDGLHFGCRDGEVGGCGPDAVAFAVEDGGFVEVSGADEAVWGNGVVSIVEVGWVVGEVGIYLVSTYAIYMVGSAYEQTTRARALQGGGGGIWWDIPCQDMIAV